MTEATAPETTEAAAPEGTKQCPGAPKFGIPAHDAPFSAFGKAAYRKDGMTRMCSADDKLYRKAVTEAKAAGTYVEGRIAKPKAVKTPKAAKSSKPVPRLTPEQEAGVKPKRAGRNIVATASGRRDITPAEAPVEA